MSDATGRRDGQNAITSGRTRAQSTVLGLILLLAITISLIGVLLVVSADASNGTSSELTLDRAEKTLTQFDSKTAVVALGSTNSQSVALSTSGDGQYTVRPSRGWLNVSLTNQTSDRTVGLVNVTLGSVVYDNAAGELAYQGGGVWKNTPGGATMVSPPEFHYRNATLTLPIITVDGDPSTGSSATVNRRSTSTRFPNRTANPNWANPLTHTKVNVTVHSEYYRAWARFFEYRTDGVVGVNHDRETATITLVTPPDKRSVTNAVAATSAGGEIRVKGNGARTDSYNSLNGGTYATTNGSQGTVVTAGTVYVGGDGSVQGSIRSGKSVKVTGNGFVDGDVAWTTSEQIKEAQVTGEITRIDGVEGDAPIDSFLETRMEMLAKQSENGSTSAISSGTLSFSGSETLTAGEYYLENLVLDGGDDLTLDTSAGNVSIAVEDYVRIDDGSTLEVVGDGRANIYVRGAETDPVSKKHFTITTDGGQVQVPEENSTQLWLYGKQHFEGRIDGTSSGTQRFEGVIYAPGGALGSSSVYVKHGELFGGVVTASVRLDQGGTVHYDRALQNARVLPENAEILRITFLHVSENNVAVTG